MTVNYKGQDASYKYRIAEINFSENEFSKIERIAKVMEIKGYNIDIVTREYALCEVYDMNDYKDFMKEWKQVKKAVALWEKFGI